MAPIDDSDINKGETAEEKRQKQEIVKKKLIEESKKSKLLATLIGSIGGASVFAAGACLLFSIPIFGQLMFAAAGVGAAVGGYIANKLAN
uniref:Uncharacterized protein n=1 Tax=Meloidogyne hapla TaxID=6305 RepID=A0A1I8BDN6_MELHA